MRTIAATLLLVVGAAVGGRAQQPPATSAAAAAPSQQTELPAGLLPEPHALSQAVDFAGRWLDGGGQAPRDGLYPDFGDLVTGAGWISAGPGYRRHLLDDRLFVDGSAAISWRAYKKVEGRVELPRLAGDRLTAGFHAEWQDLTQVNYFGIGPGSSEADRSEYRLRDTDLAGYGMVRANHWLSIGGRFGWMKQPTISASTGPFDRDFPDAREVFPNDPGVSAQASMLHGGVAAEADTRDYPGRPTHGGLYRAAAQIFSDRDLHQFSFRRYEAEGLQIFPVAGARWAIALHGWGVFSDTPGDNSVPFYLLPSLGGLNTVRGYHDYRFHDRNLLVANAESRWALFEHIDAAAFFDAGNVASRAGDLDLDKTSYGAGLRVHTRTSTLGRLDVAHSREGWHVFFGLNDPFRLSRRSLRASVIPFVP